MDHVVYLDPQAFKALSANLPGDESFCDRKLLAQ